MLKTLRKLWGTEQHFKQINNDEFQFYPWKYSGEYFQINYKQKLKLSFFLNVYFSFILAYIYTFILTDIFLDLDDNIFAHFYIFIIAALIPLYIFPLYLFSFFAKLSPIKSKAKKKPAHFLFMTVYIVLSTIPYFVLSTNIDTIISMLYFIFYLRMR